MLIVGLGNPGPSYANTRHNVGFMVADELLRRHSCRRIEKASFEGELFRCDDFFILKPLTFMNLSGRSVLAVKNFYKIDEVLVVHDDLDLPFCTLRFKRGGGHGGHNGLKSVDAAIGKDYLRVRMGIGHPGDRSRVSDYVLSPFEENDCMEAWIAKAADAVEALRDTPLDRVASLYTIKQMPLQ